MDKFSLIKQEYKAYYDSLLRQNKIPVRSTKLGLWGITPLEPLYKFFKEFQLEKYRNFLDLGSGDGCVVALASLFTRAVGLEIDEELYEKSVEIKSKLNLNAEFYNKDYFEIDFSGYDVIFINPDNRFSKGLDKKLKQELDGILLVYGIVHEPSTLKKGKKFWLEQMPITVYTHK